MTAARQAHLLITAVMNVVIVVTVVIVLRIIVDFFGVLAASQAGSMILQWTAVLVPELGIAPIRTPYGGVFDVEAVVVVVLLLVVEWVLAVVRSRA